MPPRPNFPPNRPCIKLAIFDVPVEAEPAAQPASTANSYPPRLRIKVGLSIETDGTYILGYVENIGDQTARDVRLSLPKVGTDGQFDLAPGGLRTLRFKYHRDRDDGITPEPKLFAVMQFRGDSADWRTSIGATAVSFEEGACPAVPEPRDFLTPSI